MEQRARERFETEELAVVMSHFDLGIVESVTEFARGSHQSPKVGIVARRGKFLLKKRAAIRRSRRKVELAHAVQDRLDEIGFPLPSRMRTRDGGASVRRAEDVYEMFEYVVGNSFDGSETQTRSAGRTLAQLHRALADVDATPGAPTGSFHDTIAVRTALNSVQSTLAEQDEHAAKEVSDELVQALYDLYDNAADAADAGGCERFETQLIHGDWHPGNMLFKHDAVAAVLDFDSCRIAPREIDVANGCLHFSLISGGDPSAWPAEPNRASFRAFLDGYRSEGDFSDGSVRALPDLMIEALIAESVLPIVHTGSFGKWAGPRFLEMVERKTRWLRDHRSSLLELVAVSDAE